MQAAMIGMQHLKEGYLAFLRVKVTLAEVLHSCVVFGVHELWPSCAPAGGRNPLDILQCQMSIMSMAGSHANSRLRLIAHISALESRGMSH